MGVDIRVDHAIIFGLPDTPEYLLQEGGRPKRGAEVNNRAQGYAFFFHRGQLGNSRLFVCLCSERMSSPF